MTAFAAVILATAPAGAVTYTWDADFGTAGNQDGSGFWELGNWDAGGTPNQPWADGNDE